MHVEGFSFLNENTVFLFHILQLLKTSHPAGEDEVFTVPAGGGHVLFAKHRGSTESGRVLRIISEHPEWRR